MNLKSRRPQVFFLILVLACFRCSSPGQRWSREKDRFTEIYQQVKTDYFQTVDLNQLTYAALDSLMESLDPHSYFLDPLSLRSLMEDQNGEFYGIGIRVTKYGRRLTVISALAQSPAARMGILPGDVIVEIDQQETDRLTLTEAMKLMRGDRDTVVSIKIYRAAGDRYFYFSLRRVKIPLTTVAYHLRHPLDRRIGYIAIQTFGNTTPKEVLDILRDFQRKGKGMSALILDLRNNAGGSLPACVTVADFFLPPGREVVTVRGRHSQRTLLARRDDGFETLPVAVLINYGSASASEILAAALQDNRRGVVIGERSFGKGLVETIYRLPGDSAMALTTAQYYTPGGKSLQKSFALYRRTAEHPKTPPSENRGGVIPDIPVPEGEYPEFVSRLITRGIFFGFSRQLLAGGFQPPPDFLPGPDLMKQFVDYLKNREVIFTSRDLAENRLEIRREIKRDLLYHHHSPAEAWRFFLTRDPASMEAVKYLKQQLSKGGKEPAEGTGAGK